MKKPNKKKSGKSALKSKIEKRKSFLKNKPVHSSKKVKNLPKFDGTTRLNKYLANAGICSRREADTLIQSGIVSVNGKVVTEMGYKVQEGDTVKYGDQTLGKEKKTYLLLNKPKGFTTTLHEDRTKKTVMNLIKEGNKKGFLFPVEKLNKDFTGVMLFTNDRDFALKLGHPKLGVHQVYHVMTDRNVSQKDLTSMCEGVTVNEAFLQLDKAQAVNEEFNSIGVELTKGTQKTIKKLFEHFGYKISKIDRVTWGVVSKKDLPRGRWRFLTDNEVAFFKKVK